MLRRPLLVFLILLMHPAALFAGEIKHRFLRIFEPNEGEKYATTATVASVGYFYFLDREWKPDDLRIRVRIYRPVNDDFELFQEDEAEIGRPLPGDPATLQFSITVKPKKVPKPGKYLLRVDCFDKTGKEEKLLASNSVFLTFVEARKNRPVNEARQSRSIRTREVSRVGRRPNWVRWGARF